MRPLFGSLISAVFALGTYVAYSDGPDMIDHLLHPPKPAAAKVFVPPPKPTVVTVEAPEIPAPPLPPVIIPGMKLPK